MQREDDLVEGEGVNAGSAVPQSDSDVSSTGRHSGGPVNAEQQAAPVDAEDAESRTTKRVQAPGQQIEVGEG